MDFLTIPAVMLGISVYVGFAAQWGKGHVGAVWGLITFALCCVGVVFARLCWWAVKVQYPLIHHGLDPVVLAVIQYGLLGLIWVVMTSRPCRATSCR